MANNDSSQQISLPYLFIMVVIAGAVIRFLFFSPSNNSAPAQRHNPLNVLRTREAAVERIQQMFPQVERRTILWDLQRNGGNVQATSERILAGRLEEPPVTFQPPPPIISGTAASSTSSSTTMPKKPAAPSQPDLITRYKLQDKLAASTKAAEEQKQQDRTGKAWSSDRDERQAALQRRRDEMILQARRKMEAKLAAEQGASAGVES